jgi:flagellar hook-associated protein 1 FlgK
LGSLFASLTNSANALKAFEDGLTVVQNNVTNATTPGYVEQTQVLEADPLNLSLGLTGGVSAGPVVSSRDLYAEESVRQQQTALGLYSQKVSDLTPLQSFFDLSSTSGLAPSMDALFSSFSQLSVNPNDTVSRQDVLNKAATVAQQFNSAASGLLGQTSNLDEQTRSIIENVNQLAATIAQVNSSGRVDADGTVNAGVDAQLNSSLEQLSQFVNFTTLQQPDGTVSVLVGGQTPLVVGDQSYAIQGDFSTPQTAILSSTGADITDQITGGQLSGVVDDNNNVIPSYVTDLNTLAQSFADQVNTTLDNGIDQNGAAPTTDLFTYDPVQGAALTLAVNPLTTDQIAAALPGAAGGNGNALAVAQLANATGVNGYTFDEFYGNLGGRVGNDVATATDSQTTKQNLLSQAQTLRQQVSGVSLDTEAEKLLAFQKSYEATSKMFTVLNELTETLMGIIPTS